MPRRHLFIRCGKTRNRCGGEPYTTNRLVPDLRVGTAVKQPTLPSLSSHFELPHGQWPAVAARMDR